MKRLLFIVTVDWHFVSHRLFLAKSAVEAGYKVAVICHVSKHREILESNGIEVFNWNLSRGSSNIFLEIKSIIELLQTIKKFRPNIVHAVALKPVIYAAFTSFFFKFKRVSALGGLGFVFSSNKRIAKLIRFFVVLLYYAALGGKNSKVILQNNDDIKLLTHYKIIRKNNVCLIRGAGVDTTAFSPSHELKESLLVLLPARMLWDKGVGEFISAAKELKSEFPTTKFVLVGEPDMHNPESITEKQLQEWVSDSVVEWWGHMENMPKVLQQADIVCLPTYREGLPKALLEAASCEKPIVVFNVPGCREVVQNEVNGFLVPFKDQSAINNAIKDLLRSRTLRLQMGRAGRRIILEHFSQEKIAAETISVWQELLV
jgi:glycosyltransferase involved in cell wall biosynthesis